MNSPVQVNQSGVLSGKTIRSIAAGAEHTLVLCVDGTLASWGRNHRGQLGDGTTNPRNAPVLVDQSGVLASKNVIAISAGRFHSIALCDDGSIASWGDNQNGKLGINVSGGTRTTPVLVDDTNISLYDTFAISAGYDHTMALSMSGQLIAWGLNDNGQLGDGTIIRRLVPVHVNQSGVLSNTFVTMVQSGKKHTLALCYDGTIATWGDGTFGQIGNGSTSDSSNPEFVDQSGVLSGKTVEQIATWYDHNVVLCADYTLAAWGLNTSGQLGDGGTTNQDEPVLVNQPLVEDQDDNTYSYLPHFVSTGRAQTLLLATVDGLVDTGGPGDGDPIEPNIEVKDDASGNKIQSTEIFDFEGQEVDQASSPKTFLITNTGTEDLTGLAVSIDGLNADNFAFDDSALATTLAPEATTTFTVTFTPDIDEERSAQLHIASNDPDENPFDIELRGEGFIPIVFTDPNLEAALRAILGIPVAPLSPEDMEGIQILDLTDQGITDLAGLESAINMTHLYIRGNPFADEPATMDFISDLTNLSLQVIVSDLPYGSRVTLPPGEQIGELTDTSGDDYYLTILDSSPVRIDLGDLDIDPSDQGNYDVIQDLYSSGVSIESSPIPYNSYPTADASYMIVNIATGETNFDGSPSSDLEGSISDYSWSWDGGDATGITATVYLPSGSNTVTLTVTDSDSSTDNYIFLVDITDLSSVLESAGLTGDDALPGSIPYHDGVSNLLKYALNMNLGGPDSSKMAPGGTAGLPVGGLVEVEGQTYWQVQYVVRRNSGLNYTPQKSSTLAPNSFVPLTATPLIEAINDEWERHIFNEPCTPETEDKCFSRLKVDLP